MEELKNIFKKDFKLNFFPKDKKEAIDLIEEYESLTKYIKLPLCDLKVFRIIKDDNKFFYLVSINQIKGMIFSYEKSVRENLSEGKEISEPEVDFPNLLKIEKEKIDKNIVNRIEAGDIRTILALNNDIIFMDENARSVIASKTGASGKILYSRDLFADINIQSLLQQSAAEVLPVAVIRKYGNVNLLISLLSDKRRPVKLSKLPELRDDTLTVSRMSISNYQVMIEFDIKCSDTKIDTSPFIPSIRISWSDAGRGLLKKSFCVRTNKNKRSCIIKEIPIDYDKEELLKEFSAISEKNIEKFVSQPFTTVSQNLRRTIGKKRLEMIRPLIKKDVSEQEFFKIILSLPDVIGEINDTTDLALESVLGNIFLHGAELKAI